jgi:hypothetical protein
MPGSTWIWSLVAILAVVALAIYIADRVTVN